MQLVNTWWSACRRCLRVFLALGLGFLLLTSPRQCLANTEECEYHFNVPVVPRSVLTLVLLFPFRFNVSVVVPIPF